MGSRGNVHGSAGMAGRLVLSLCGLAGMGLRVSTRYQAVTCGRCRELMRKGN